MDILYVYYPIITRSLSRLTSRSIGENRDNPYRIHPKMITFPEQNECTPMSQLLFRQLKDIQFQAERLVSGNPEGEELENFSNYNEELKNYILMNIEDADLRKVVLEIPHVMDIETETNSTPFYVLLFLGIATLGVSAFYISYVANLRRTRQILNNVQTVRGKYASLEFLMRVRE